MARATGRDPHDPPGPRAGREPLNLSTAVVLSGVAVDGWLLALVAIRGRRPWLQATFAACALSFLVAGASFVGRNEGLLPPVREDVVLGLLLLTHALTAILVLGLIHGEALPANAQSRSSCSPRSPSSRPWPPPKAGPSPPPMRETSSVDSWSCASESHWPRRSTRATRALCSPRTRSGWASAWSP